MSLSNFALAFSAVNLSLFNSDGLFAVAKYLVAIVAVVLFGVLCWTIINALLFMNNIINKYSKELSDIKLKVDTMTKSIDTINAKIDTTNANIDSKFAEFVKNQIDLNNRMSYVEGFSGVSRYNRRT